MWVLDRLSPTAFLDKCMVSDSSSERVTKKLDPEAEVQYPPSLFLHSGLNDFYHQGLKN